MSLQGPRRHQALGRPGRRRRQPDQHRPRHGRSARALTASFDHNFPWQAAAPTAAAIVLSSPAHAPRETSFLRRKVAKAARALGDWNPDDPRARTWLEWTRDSEEDTTSDASAPERRTEHAVTRRQVERE